MAAVNHPYSPVTLEVPGFTDPVLSQEYILGVFAACSVVAVAIAWIVSGRFKYLSNVERVLVCWWLFTGLVHVILEGYFAFTPDFFTKTNFLAEVWKEYGRGDSRYPGRDTTIVLIEGITAAIEGPASLLAVYAILYRKPYQHALQLAISLGQLYGDVVYFLTAYFAVEEFAAPGVIYFWGYFIFMNAIWIVVPILTATRSWNKICDAQATSTVVSKKTE